MVLELGGLSGAADAREVVACYAKAIASGRYSLVIVIVLVLCTFSAFAQPPRSRLDEG